MSEGKDGALALLLGPAPEPSSEKKDELEVSELDRAMARDFLSAGDDAEKLAKLFHMLRNSKG